MAELNLTWTEQEFMAGYFDGRDPNSPEPNENRSHCYRHSFAVARAERAGKRIKASVSRELAAEAERKDSGW